MKIFKQSLLSFLLILTSVFSGVLAAPATPAPQPQMPGAPAAIQIVSLDGGEIELQLSAPSYTIETGPDFDRLTVPGAPNSAQAGQPALPVLGALVGVPPQAKIRLEIVDNAPQTLDGRYRIASAPRPAALQNDFDTSNLWEELPAQMGVQPAQAGGALPVARIAEEAWIRDQRVVRIEYRPFEYHPQTGTLVWYPQVRVRLRFEMPPGKTLPMRESAASAAESPFEALLQAALLNYAQARNWRGYPQAAAQVAPPEVGARYRIEIDRDGIYKLTYADLYAADPSIASLDPRQLQMTSQGQAVAIQVVGESDGSFDPGDYILFYGERFHGERLASLYQDENTHWITLTQQLTDGSAALWQPEFNAVMLEKYTYDNVYWLFAGQSNGLRMDTLDGDPSGNSNAPVPYYRETVHAEQRNLWKTTLFQGEDTWYWDRIQQNDVFFAYTTTVTAPSASGPDAVVRGDLVAAVYNAGPNPDHHSQIYLNSTTTILDEDYWSGTSRLRFTGSVSPTTILSGENTLRVMMVNTIPEIYAPDYYFDWFEIEYNRLFQAENNAIRFSHTASGAQKYQVSGFSDTANLIVLDVTEPLTPVRVLNPAVSSGQVTISLTHSEPPTRTIAMDGNPQPPKAGRISYYQPPDWGAISNGFDYIYITHADLLTATQSLASYRAAQSGLSTAVFDIQDLYNEFNYGIFHPIAIKNFLAYTFASWSTPPRYVLLVGDGHWNFHEDNLAYYGSGVQYIPPNLAWVDPWQGEVDSANLLANVVGSDPLADVFIARLPVENSAEIDAYRAKLTGYEAAHTPEPWEQNHLFVADNADGAGDFATLADQIINEYVDPSSAAAPLRIYQDDYGCTSSSSAACDAVRHAITNTLNITGASLVSYIGHASVSRWSHERIFTPSQFPDLTNADQLPVLISMDCLDGYWSGPAVYPGSSMIEEIVRMSNTGAIAAFSPTGLGVSSGHDILHQGFYQSLLENGVWALGSAAQYAKLQLYAAGSHPDLLHTFTVFGDPALEIRNPFRAFTATPAESTRITLIPGATLTHTLALTNTSAVSDSYQLDITSNWTVTLPYNATPDIPPGGVLDIPIAVTVPMQYGVSDTATLTITSRGDSKYAFTAQLHTSILLPGQYHIFLPLVIR